jgi:hypothetical protein
MSATNIIEIKVEQQYFFSFLIPSYMREIMGLLFYNDFLLYLTFNLF